MIRNIPILPILPMIRIDSFNQCKDITYPDLLDSLTPFVFRRTCKTTVLSGGDRGFYLDGESLTQFGLLFYIIGLLEFYSMGFNVKPSVSTKTLSSLTTVQFCFLIKFPGGRRTGRVTRTKPPCHG